MIWNELSYNQETILSDFLHILPDNPEKDVEGKNEPDKTNILVFRWD